MAQSLLTLLTHASDEPQTFQGKEFYPTEKATLYDDGHIELLTNHPRGEWRSTVSYTPTDAAYKVMLSRIVHEGVSPEDLEARLQRLPPRSQQTEIELVQAELSTYVERTRTALEVALPELVISQDSFKIQHLPGYNGSVNSLEEAIALLKQCNRTFRRS